MSKHPEFPQVATVRPHQPVSRSRISVAIVIAAVAGLSLAVMIVAMFGVLAWESAPVQRARDGHKLSQLEVKIYEPTPEQIKQYDKYLATWPGHQQRWASETVRATDEHNARMAKLNGRQGDVFDPSKLQPIYDEEDRYLEECSRIDAEFTASRPVNPLPHGLRRVVIQLTNQSGQPLSRASLRVRRMATGRAVPISDDSETFSPVGGIETGETKEASLLLDVPGHFDRVEVEATAIFGPDGELIAQREPR